METKAQEKAAEQFHQELYSEHLEEIGLAFIQSRDLVSLPDKTWQQVRRIDHKLNRHLLAVDRGGSIARKSAVKLLEESRRALDELTGLLELGSVYSFQA